MLDIRNLQFSHSGQTGSAYNFELCLDAGMILAITGRSGSGKSTLLDLIAGFLKPDHGKVMINGRDVTVLPPSRRKISILFQKNNLFEHMSALENVCLGLNPNSSPASAQKKQASWILARMNMEGFENHLVKTLSGGQAQRVALARELVRDSELILLDEPFNGLDEETRDFILPLLKQATASGRRSIAMTTHDLKAVQETVTRRVEIREGRIYPF